MRFDMKKIKQIIFVTLIAILVNASVSTAYASEVVPVRVVHHESFSRVTFNLPRLISYTKRIEDTKIYLDFDIEARAVFSSISTPIIKKIIQRKTPSNKFSILISTNDQTKINEKRIEKKVFIDIYKLKLSDKKPIQQKRKPAGHVDIVKKVKEAKKGITSIDALKKAVKNLLPPEERLEPKTKPTKHVKQKEEIKKKLAPFKSEKLTTKTAIKGEDYYTKNTSKITISFLDPTNIAIIKRAGLFWIITDSTSLRSLPSIKGPLEKFIRPPKVVTSDNGISYAYKLPFDLYPKVTKKHLMWEIELLTSPIKKRPKVDLKMISNRFGTIKKVGIPLKGAHKVIEFEDPIVGDKLYIAPTDDATQSISNTDTNSDFEIRPSYLGLVIRPLRDNLIVYSVEDYIFVTSQLNLNLTQQNMGAPILIDDNITTEENIDKLRLFDFPKWRKSGITFLQANKTALQKRIAKQEDKEKRTGLMMLLARLYFANHYGHEALGVLSLISQQNPEIRKHPDFIAIRGAANAISGRYQEAIKDFSFASIQHNPEIKLWRGYAAAKAEQWRMADRTFPRDNRILLRYPENIAIPFTIYMAESFLHLGHKKEAAKLLNTVNIRSKTINLHYRSAISYLRGEIARQNKDFKKAKRLWTPVSKGRDRLYHTKASLSLTRLLHEQKKISTEEAIERIETLRFAWRGDGLEAEILRNLGKLKAQNGLVLTGLLDLQNAVDTSEALRIESDHIIEEMENIFYKFFTSKKNSTIEAISIYNGFKHLLPEGEKGATINLKFADYLISADLLSDAATVLENHLPISNSDKITATLGAKLANIYLIDNKTNKALEALAKTIVEKVDNNIVKERIFINARIHTKLKNYNVAIRLLNKLKSKEARLLKATIYWETKKWRKVAETLGTMVKENEIANVNKKARTILNIAVAWKLDGNIEKLKETKNTYNDLMLTTKYIDMFKVITRSGGASTLSDRKNTLKIAAEVDIFSNFLKSFKSIED